MAAFVRMAGHHCVLRTLCCKSVANAALFRPQWTKSMAVLAEKANESFQDKNKRLSRPMSPHLGIYKWEITMIMSISHRTTGLIMTGGLYSFAIGMMALPGSFPYYLSLIQAMHLGAPLIYAAKFLIAFPLMFHSCAGIRHLVWDLGKGFQIKTLHMSGYAAATAALALTALAAAY